MLDAQRLTPEPAEAIAASALTACSKLHGPDSGRAIADLTATVAEVEEAALVLVRTQPAAALGLVAAMREFWVLSGRQGSAIGVVTTVLETAGEQPPERAATEVCAGTLAFFNGDTEGAARHHEKALRQAEAAGLEPVACDALIGLARVAMQRGQLGEMARRAAESGRLARGLGDELRQAVALHHQAVAADLGGDPLGAALHEETLRIQRRLGNQRGVALELLNLGLLALGGTELGAARNYLAEAYGVFRTLRVERNVALTLALYGAALCAGGDQASGALLLGTGTALKRALGTTFTVAADRHLDAALANCRDTLGEARLEELLEEGAQSEPPLALPAP